MKVYRLMHVIYWTLATLRMMSFIGALMLLYGAAGCILAVPYLFLAGESWSEIIDKLPIAVAVLPIIGGILLCAALKVHELWECVHRDRYVWSTIFLLLVGYVLLPIILNVVAQVFVAVGFVRLSIIAYGYRYQVLGVPGGIGITFLGIHLYRSWRMEQQSKKSKKKRQTT